MKNSIKIALTIIIFSIASLESQAITFSDINETNPYYIAITYLSDKAIIKGYSDGNFKPFNNINRAELLKITMEGAKVNLAYPETDCFTDVPSIEWYAPYICTAKDLGYIKGYNDGSFRPENDITKVEAIKIIGEVFDWELNLLPEVELFSDTPSNEWYIPYLKYAKTKNLLPEYNEKYYPASKITRASVSETIYRTLSIKELNQETFDSSSFVLLNETFTQISKEDVKIILTWEDKKADFDAHLLTKEGEEIFFMYRITPDLKIILDIDSAQKNGTETITIKDLEQEDYEYFVHNYSDSKSFSNSNAKVEIYDKNGLIKTYYPPTQTNDTEEIWKVFTIIDAKEIIDFNTVGSCEILENHSSICPVENE